MELSKRKILIVDDDELVLSVLSLLLTPYLCEIKTINSPGIVMETINEFQPDLIILDMNYTKGNYDGHEGIYWLQNIKKENPESKIIVFSGSFDSTLLTKAYDIGAIGHLEKPWKNEELIKLIIEHTG